jgi:hypothetical protein
MFCFDDEKRCFKCIVFHVLQNAILHKKVIILFDFLLGLCVVLNFFFPILCILVLKDDVWRLVNIVLFPYCR